MAEGNTGFIFTQNGVPVRGSADYQRLFDSRWRFMEIEQEVPVSFTFPEAPAVGSAARYYQIVELVHHGLGFLPAFETDIVVPDAFFGVADRPVWSDKNRIFARRLVTTLGKEAVTVTGTIRIYNLPILEEYVAPKGLPEGLSSARGDAGVKFIDGDRKSVNVQDKSSVGFSLNTQQKVLAIHKHGTANINDATGHTLGVSAIDTSTNILTVASAGPNYPYPDEGTTYFQNAIRLITYNPGDFFTYPAPLELFVGYYTIPVDATHVKLAATRELAEAGVAIDLTTAGSLPATMQASYDEGDNEIVHDVGYPPTYILAETNFRDYFTPIPNYDPGQMVGPLLNVPPTYIRADKRVLSFYGVQAVFTGTYGYIILKDPAEIAR